MKQSVFVFSDLDDTLLQTQRKCITAGPLTEAAVDREGRPLSFHSQEQLLLLQIFKPCTLIPVTGRNLEALGRIRSPSFSSYRITSHGALVWHANNILIPDWKRKVEQEAVIWEPRMQHLLAAIEDYHKAERIEDLRFRIIYDSGIPVYLSIKGNPKQISVVEKVISPLWVQEMGGVIHCNDRNMALLPPYADKGKAVRYVMELIRGYCEFSPLFIGMGDSLTDISFLRACHYALTPQNSQIHQEIWG
jgi:hydroxymethylpyrimidine pyrophosphatase-like HAD family hydrolase